MDGMLRQGVTTVVVGNCGGSAFPYEGVAEHAAIAGADAAIVGSGWETFDGYLSQLQACRPALNVAALVGHGTLREAVMREDQRRAPSVTEMAEMRHLLGEALEQGALGLSTGLFYAPGTHATTDEIVELAGEMGRRGGIYASHVRDESRHVFDAVGECIDVGRRAGVPSHISHLKVESRSMWGRAPDLLALIDEERDRGADVTSDQYPYTAWETGLAAVLPGWTSPQELPDTLADDRARERLRTAVEEGGAGREGPGRALGWDRIVIGSHEPDPALIGHSIADLAEARGLEPFEVVARLILADPYTGMIGHGMHEDDVRMIASRPDVFAASDGVAVSPSGPLGSVKVHPRYYGTFARVLGRYARQEGLLTLGSAIRKMTSLPAQRFGLTGRGLLEEDAFADLVVFDPDRVIDRATYEHPHAFADGIELVIVNGQVAWDGAPGARAGRALRRGER